MTDAEIVQRANDLVTPFGLNAEILPGIRSVGIRGDARAYLPTMNLSGAFPGHDILAELSTRITNELEIGRVTFQLGAQYEDRVQEVRQDPAGQARAEGPEQVPPMLPRSNGGVQAESLDAGNDNF